VAGGGKVHIVFVVDCSGSMRTADVANFADRKEAVYHCIVEDCVAPLRREHKKLMREVEVSLIEFADVATVVMSRWALRDTQLVDELLDRGEILGRGHGNYHFALAALKKLVARDREDPAAAVAVFFMSDGAPSDYLHMGFGHRDPEPLRRMKQRLRAIGQALGPERFCFAAAAFGECGPEACAALQQLSAAVPHASFQRTGCSAAGLGSMLRSFSSSVSSLATDSIPSIRTPFFGRRTCPERTLDLYESTDTILAGRGNSKPGKALLAKKRYDLRTGGFVEVPLNALSGTTSRASALGVLCTPIGEGAERVVFPCYELRLARGRALEGVPTGRDMVAKEPRTLEDLQDEDFQPSYCRKQAIAAKWAAKFNQELGTVTGFAGAVLGPAINVSYVPCWLYIVADKEYYHQVPGGVVDIVAEELLEGTFTKWNSNGGRVGGLSHSGSSACFALGAIAEEQESDSDSDGEDDSRQVGQKDRQILDSVIQAFSHYTYVKSGGQQLVCDLQGVWNWSDGFVLTDPAIHSVDHTFGRTDMGRAGMHSFLQSHTCGPACRCLGLHLAR